MSEISRRYSEPLRDLGAPIETKNAILADTLFFRCPISLHVEQITGPGATEIDKASNLHKINYFSIFTHKKRENS